jgi:hypothetical protein
MKMATISTLLILAYIVVFGVCLFWRVEGEEVLTFGGTGMFLVLRQLERP